MLRRLAGGTPDLVDGNLLDARTQLILGVHSRLPAAPPETETPERARVQMKQMLGLLSGPAAPVQRTEDLQIPLRDGQRIAARLYVPSAAASGGSHAGLVYFHGGGWVIGDLDTHDGLCRELASISGCRVLSVDYRLAPEHRFPTAAHDAIDAVRWTHENATLLRLDPGRIAVGGDSAGGNLAAVAALELRGEGARPSFQLLLYPATDLRNATASHHTFRDGYVLTSALMNWFRGHYLADPSLVTDPRVSPLLAPDHSGLPPAYVITAGFDVLRDEGRAYANALERAGVPVRYRCWASLIHGFAQTTGAVPEARAAVRDAAEALAKGLE